VSLISVLFVMFTCLYFFLFCLYFAITLVNKTVHNVIIPSSAYGSSIGLVFLCTKHICEIPTVSALRGR